MPNSDTADHASVNPEKALTARIAKNPDDAGAILKLCRILMRRDRPMKALAWLHRQTVQNSPQIRFQRDACELQIEIGDFDGAARQATTALALEADEALAALRAKALRRLAEEAALGLTPALKQTYMMAMQQLQRGSAAEAGAMLEAVVAAAPRYYPAWIGLRGALEVQGDAGADALADRWIAADPQGAGIARIVMARRLHNGLLFDHQTPLPFRPMRQTLREVSSREALVASAAAVLPLDPGGATVTLDPVISQNADGSDRIVLTYQTPEVFLAGLENAALVGRGLVVDAENQLAPELHGPNLGKYGMIDQGGTVAFDPIFLRSWQGPVKVYDTPALLMTGASDKSFGDWVLIFAPRLAIARAGGLRCPVVVADHCPEPFLELLRQLGVADEDILRHDATSISLFRKLYVPSWPLRGYLEPMAGLFDIFRDLVLPSTPGPGRRIYLSRERVARRDIVNEAEISATFARRGFEIIHPQELSLLQMRQLMADADYVAAPYGSALLNLAMAGRKPKTIALVPPLKAGFRKQAAMWLGSMGLQFAYVSGRPESESGELGIKDVPWSVPIRKVEAALTSLGL